MLLGEKEHPLDVITVREFASLNSAISGTQQSLPSICRPMLDGTAPCRKLIVGPSLLVLHAGWYPRSPVLQVDHFKSWCSGSAASTGKLAECWLCFSGHPGSKNASTLRQCHV